jgi:hypothetical protein
MSGVPNDTSFVCLIHALHLAVMTTSHGLYKRLGTAVLQVGMQVLMGNGSAFQCHQNMTETIWKGELGSSFALLQAGYNLDSLLLRYQGVDWRDPATWSCNHMYARVIHLPR